MKTMKAWQFWLTFGVGTIIMPIVVIVLGAWLNNVSTANELLKKELAITDFHTQFTDLRGLLTEVYVRFNGDNLPDAYWVAVDEARSARLSLLDDNHLQAYEKMRNAYDKVYSIPMPVGPPLIHDEPVDVDFDL